VVIRTGAVRSATAPASIAINAYANRGSLSGVVPPIRAVHIVEMGLQPGVAWPQHRPNTPAAAAPIRAYNGSPVARSRK
jgi:hypothetical protein